MVEDSVNGKEEDLEVGIVEAENGIDEGSVCGVVGIDEVLDATEDVAVSALVKLDSETLVSREVM